MQRSLELFHLVKLKGDFKILVHGDFVFWFWSQHEACGILVLQPGIEPTPPALEALSLDHWTSREVLTVVFKIWSYDFHFFLPFSSL